MWKKFASLVLSLLVCLTLLPGQTRAADLPEPPGPGVIVEPVEPEDPGGTVMPMSEAFPDPKGEDHPT